jgi:hypothetical protein
MPLGLPKTRSALLVLIVRGLSGTSSYNLDDCLEVLTARDLVVIVGETVRPSLGTAVIGVTPPETLTRDVGLETAGAPVFVPLFAGCNTQIRTPIAKDTFAKTNVVAMDGVARVCLAPWEHASQSTW